MYRRFSSETDRARLLRFFAQTRFVTDIDVDRIQALDAGLGGGQNNLRSRIQQSVPTQIRSSFGNQIDRAEA